jgi:flagellum-specific peptidoglycan hydrolase FlgJ
MDHANFMLKNNYKHCLKKTSVAQYNVCIEKGGYATGANYGQKLNRVTSDYGLDAFDGLTKAEAAEVAKKIK